MWDAVVTGGFLVLMSGAAPRHGITAPVLSPPAMAEHPAAPEADSERLILEGLRRLKAADYRGAVDVFRSAVVESEGNSRAIAYFALGLIITSDGKNADKALREAVRLGFSERVDFSSLFRDDKEASRIKGILSGVSGDGLLVAAWAEHLGGASDRLKRLAEKDPVARHLAGL